MSEYLRPNQIEEMKAERDVLRRTINTRKFDDISHLERQGKKLEAELEAKTPPTLTGAELDEVARREAKIRQELIDFGMPSHEEMRKNPPGVVGRHMRWEAFAKQKTPEYPIGRIFQWKQDRLVLNKGSDDPDQANFEQYRPTTSYGNMVGAQIPGQQFYGINPSPEYKANYEQTFGENEIDLKNELARLREELAQVQAKAAHQKADETVADSTKSFTRQAACGQVFEKPSPNGAAGAVRFHEQKCEKCLAKKLEGAD
jgi:hypothetical protein